MVMDDLTTNVLLAFILISVVYFGLSIRKIVQKQAKDTVDQLKFISYRLVDIQSIIPNDRYSGDMDQIHRELNEIRNNTTK